MMESEEPPRLPSSSEALLVDALVMPFDSAVFVPSSPHAGYTVVSSSWAPRSPAAGCGTSSPSTVDAPGRNRDKRRGGTAML